MKQMVAGAVVGALIVAGCGTGSGGVVSLSNASIDDASDETSTQSSEDAILALAQCLRDRGLEIEDPQFDERGRPSFGGGQGNGAEFQSEEFREAFRECREEVDLPFGPGQSDDPRETAELEDAQEAIRTCMRDQGYDLPSFDGSAPGESTRERFDEIGEQAGFEDAVTACAESAGLDGPAGRGGGRGGAGGFS